METMGVWNSVELVPVNGGCYIVCKFQNPDRFVYLPKSDIVEIIDVKDLEFKAREVCDNVVDRTTMSIGI